MKKTLIIPVVIVGLLVGCHPEENPDQLKAVNQSLEYANGIMEEANKLVYEKLTEKKKDVSTMMVAAPWEPKSDQIKRYSDSTRAFIKKLKGELIQQSNNLKMDYVELTKQLHNADGTGGQLLNKLIAFKDSIPAVFYSGNTMNDPYRRDQLNDLLKTVPLLPAYRDSLPTGKKNDYKKKWLEKSFGRTSALMAMIMLNKIESDVLTTEHAFITFCNNQIVIGCNMQVNRFSAIATLSSSYVKAGQSIEITAGVGAFSEAARPRITINGKEVKMDVDATAIYKFIATGAPGKHTVPITFQYSKPDGTDASVSVNREYTIAEN